LARHEEREAEAEFGAAWRAYAAEVPGFIPRLAATGRA
jgi:protein-S-isoprenylcysteine O-methyltransferase Ste14